MSKPTLYIILDQESGAVEYGPSPGKDAAVAHLVNLKDLDSRSTIAQDVGRELVVYELQEI